MRVIHDTGEEGLSAWRGCVLVPTMGALHDGHAALIGAARRFADADPARPPVVVSVFVNPTQFNDAADLDRYPRTLDADVALCERAGADALFAPARDAVYPPAGSVRVPPLPAVATMPGLEDAHRPGHFAGVCQVVNRLFEMIRPAAATFGEKDWQQLRVVEEMVAQGGLGVRVIRVPTVREPDGLAMSSRNVFLSRDDRRRALAIIAALRAAAGEATARGAEERMRRVLAGASLGVEYAAVRDAGTLLAWSGAGTGRALVAARVGRVRLIDNAPWPDQARRP